MRGLPTLTVAASIVAWAGWLSADTSFVATLNGAKEVPSNLSPATGFARVMLNTAETQISVSLEFSGLTAGESAAHIHGPAAVGVNAPVIFSLGTLGTVSGSFTGLAFAVSPAQVADLKGGLCYVNVHDANFPGGEIRGQLVLDSPFEALLLGEEEVPAHASTALGYARVSLDATESHMFVSLSYTGLSSDQVAAHVHGPAAPGVNAPLLFSLGSPGGTANDITDAFFSVAPTDVANLKAGLFYVNVHSLNFPGGEIRGQLQRAAYPVKLTESQEVPPTGSPALGFGRVTLSTLETHIVTSLGYFGLSSAQTAAHIHGPAAPGDNAPVLFDLGSPGGTTGAFDLLVFTLTPAQVADLKAGLLYFNVHSTDFPDGEIRGQIDVIFRNGFE